MLKRKTACRLLALLFILSLFCSLSLPVSAAAEPPSLAEARAVYLEHLESGKVVASKDAEASVGAGSSVKVMAGLLLCEELVDDWYDEITVHAETAAVLETYAAGHRLKIKAGDSFAIYDLLYAAICASYNDAFYLLALVLDGSVDGFLARMNSRAAALGMKNTHFEDLTGIQSGSRTTAADMASLAKVAYQNELYMTIASTLTYTCTSLGNTGISFNNRNALICPYDETKYFQGECRGMSAGSSSDGNCVVTVAVHKNETYVCVVLGGEESETELYGYRIVNRLVDWVYATFSYVEVVSPEQSVCTLPVTVSNLTTAVKVYAKDSLSAYLPADAVLGEDVTYSIRLINEELEAPFEKDTHVGYLAVIYDGRVIGTVKLYTAEGAERSGIVGAIKKMQSLFSDRGFLAGLIFFVVAISAWGLIEYLLWRRRRHKWDKYFSKKMEMPEELLRRGPRNELERPRKK